MLRTFGGFLFTYYRDNVLIRHREAVFCAFSFLELRTLELVTGQMNYDPPDGHCPGRKTSWESMKNDPFNPNSNLHLATKMPVSLIMGFIVISGLGQGVVVVVGWGLE